MSDRDQHAGKDRPPSILHWPFCPVPLRMTFNELLDYHVEVSPDAPAVFSYAQDRSLSFKQLRDNSIRLARRMWGWEKFSDWHYPGQPFGKLRDIYLLGMTEMASLVTMMREADSFEKQTTTAGRVFPNYMSEMVKIVKPNTGEVLPWGAKGEIVAYGCGKVSEYLGNATKTTEILKQHPEDLDPGGVGLEDGLSLRKWLHTGDEGYLDKDGYLIISGRIKDIIIRGGENISPMEIESRLVEHDAISQATVVGVPGEKYGEELCAFVELHVGYSQPIDEELREHVRAKLARFKAPKYFLWIGSGLATISETWPQTASGKVSKPALRALLKGFHLA